MIMLKVAIVGCGKIADSHASQIQRIPGCEIVGTCDREELMAKQLAERFHVMRYYDNLDALLREGQPDVVHITTPPQSHFEIGRQCLEAGCNIYVEKPFAIDAAETEKLISLANQRGLRLTVGTDEQFSAVARQMRKLIRDGYLGGAPVHIESTWCYDLGDGAYTKALLGDKQHWARTLPGGLLHNTISHGIAKIAEYLPGESPQVIAHGFVSSFLKRLGENEIIDELRVILQGEGGTTAYFTFSSQMRPSLHEFRVFGPKNGLVFDQDQQWLIKLRGERFKSYAEKFLPQAGFAKQYLGSFFGNARLFLARDFHMNSGKKHLIEDFYRSITDGSAVPIAYREILLTSRIMDAIFTQISTKTPFLSRSEASSNA
jgi:predicted dehydrogenase